MLVAQTSHPTANVGAWTFPFAASGRYVRPHSRSQRAPTWLAQTWSHAGFVRSVTG